MLHLTATLLLTLSPCQETDWPRFGGPNGDNRVGALDTKYEWGEDGPEVLWRAETGPGFGGAAVQGGEVFLFDRELGEEDRLRVFDLATGEEKWEVSYAAPGRLMFPGSRSVPTVTKDAVYASGGFGHVVCFDRESREIRWLEHLEETYGGNDPGFGFSSSPIVIGDVVVFSALGDDVGLVAFECESGDEAWVSEPVGYSHSTPVLLELLGEPQLLILATNGPGGGMSQAAPMTISSIDPEDGSTNWAHEIMLTRLPIPGPVLVDEEHLFLTGGYGGGSTLLHVQKSDGGYAFEELFHIERGAQVHPALVHDEHLYLLVNENANEPSNVRSEGGLMCLGLDGKELWRTGDEPYFGRGNALLAGDHLLVEDGYDGTLRVIKAQPSGYEVVAEAKLLEPTGRDGQMWAPMALAGNRLLIRSQEELLCVQL